MIDYVGIASLPLLNIVNYAETVGSVSDHFGMLYGTCSENQVCIKYSYPMIQVQKNGKKISDSKLLSDFMLFYRDSFPEHKFIGWYSTINSNCQPASKNIPIISEYLSNSDMGNDLIYLQLDFGSNKMALRVFLKKYFGTPVLPTPEFVFVEMPYKMELHPSDAVALSHISKAAKEQAKETTTETVTVDEKNAAVTDQSPEQPESSSVSTSSKLQKTSTIVDQEDHALMLQKNISELKSMLTRLLSDIDTIKDEVKLDMAIQNIENILRITDLEWTDSQPSSLNHNQQILDTISITRQYIDNLNNQYFSCS